MVKQLTKQIEARNSYHPHAIEHDDFDFECDPPVQLLKVTKTEDGKEIIEVENESLDKLSKMNSEMVIVSMYGGKGVGKSFLVNCMLEFFEEG